MDNLLVKNETEKQSKAEKAPQTSSCKTKNIQTNVVKGNKPTAKIASKNGSKNKVPFQNRKRQFNKINPTEYNKLILTRIETNKDNQITFESVELKKEQLSEVIMSKPCLTEENLMASDNKIEENKKMQTLMNVASMLETQKQKILKSRNRRNSKTTGIMLFKEIDEIDNIFNDLKKISSQFPANDWKDENDCKYKNGTDGHPYWKEREEIIANKINLIKSTFQEECNKNEKKKNIVLAQDINNLEFEVDPSIKDENISEDILVEFQKIKDLFSKCQTKLASCQNEENINRLRSKLKQINETITINEVAMNLQIMYVLVEIKECKNNLEILEKSNFSNKSTILKKVYAKKTCTKTRSPTTNSTQSIQTNADTSNMLMQMISNRKHKTPSTPEVVEPKKNDESCSEETSSRPIQLRLVKKLEAYVKKMKEIKKIKN